MNDDDVLADIDTALASLERDFASLETIPLPLKMWLAGPCDEPAPAIDSAYDMRLQVCLIDNAKYQRSHWGRWSRRAARHVRPELGEDGGPPAATPPG